MHRIVFRIGALSAVVVIIGVAARVMGNPNGVVRVPETPQVATDPCLLINEVWYCWEGFQGDEDGDQGSDGLLAANV